MISKFEVIFIGLCSVIYFRLLLDELRVEYSFSNFSYG